MDEKYNNFFAHCNDLVDKFHSEVAEKKIKDILSQIEFKASIGERDYTTDRMIRDVAIMLIQHKVFKDFKITIVSGYTSADSRAFDHYLFKVPPDRTIERNTIVQLQQFINLRFQW